MSTGSSFEALISLKHISTLNTQTLTPSQIGICLILGTTYTGQYEDVKAVNDILQSRGMTTPIHVDAASGGFVAPFIVPGLQWDFRVPLVASINVSGHKYGLVYPGVGWVIFRSPEFLPQELVFTVNYLGADQSSYTLNFSKGASQIVGQYYQLIRLGKKGYREIMANLQRTADHLASVLQGMGFCLMSETGGRGLPVVAFRLDPAKGAKWDEFALAHQLRGRGWIVPAYTMAPNTNSMKMMRVVIREDFSRSRCEQLISDIKMCIGLLDDMDEKTMKDYKDYQEKRDKHLRGHRWGGERRGGRRRYEDQTHNLQGKTGKTHPVC